MNIRDAKTLARKHMKEHGLFEMGYKLKFDQAKRRFGQCSYRTKTISISQPLTLLNEKSHVNDTILHEIAHALTPGAHHGRQWKLKAAEIGANPEMYYDKTVNQPAPKYVGFCSNGHEHKRQRATRHMKNQTTACRTCCDDFNRGRYSADYTIVWLSVVN